MLTGFGFSLAGFDRRYGFDLQLLLAKYSQVSELDESNGLLDGVAVMVKAEQPAPDFPGDGGNDVE